MQTDAADLKGAITRFVIIESPFAGTGWWPLSVWRRWRNMRYARACMADALSRGEAPFASHMLYTQPGVLRDGVPSERRLGIAAGLHIAQRADATIVYKDHGISSGMRQGIEHAQRCGRPVEYRTIYQTFL